MNFRRIATAMVALMVLFSMTAFSAEKASESATPFLGRWDLTLKASGHEYPTWLEVTKEDGQIKALMTGRWGHARPLPKVEISNGNIIFVSPKDEEGAKEDMTFEGKLDGSSLTGVVNGPDGTTWHWIGERAPSLKRTGKPTWGKEIRLFNGKDLSGWRTLDPSSKETWQVKDGTLVSPGHGPELVTDAKFEDFKLHIEFNCAKGSNSGVYLRGRYEVQIEDDPEPEGPSMRTGGVYGFLAPKPEQPRRPGEWQSYDITLVGRTVTVVQNGQVI
ncbi:MAG: DUF1080 domain-containing protein, partial [Terriglobales bacterium]